MLIEDSNLSSKITVLAKHSKIGKMLRITNSYSSESLNYSINTCCWRMLSSTDPVELFKSGILKEFDRNENNYPLLNLYDQYFEEISKHYDKNAPKSFAAKSVLRRCLSPIDEMSSQYI